MLLQQTLDDPPAVALLNTNDTRPPPFALSGLFEMSEYELPCIDRNRITLIAAYCILLASGTIGNAYVILVVGRVFRQSRTEAPKSVQIFILSLALCATSSLLSVSFLLSDLIVGRWLVPSRFLCRLYLSTEGLNKFCSPFLLASLSGFCYVRLRGTPNSVHSSSSTKKSVYLVVGCVGATLLLVAPVYEFGDLYYLVEYNETHVLSMVTKCAFHPPRKLMIAFTAYGFAFGYLLPAGLFTFFYSASLYSARRQRKRSSCPQSQGQQPPTVGVGGGDPPSTPTVGGGGSPYLNRIRTTTFALIFVYLAVWTPYWAMGLYHSFTPHEVHGHESQEAIVASYFIHMLPYINCALFPLVYTLLNSHLKKDYKRARATEKRRRRQQQSTGTNNRKISETSQTRLATVVDSRMMRQQQNHSQRSITTTTTTTTMFTAALTTVRQSIDRTSTNRSSMDAGGGSRSGDSAAAIVAKTSLSSCQLIEEQITFF